MADGGNANRRRKAKAPTTADAIEIAMEAAAGGAAPTGVAQEVLKKQSVLIGWQIASERAGVGLKLLTGLGVLLAAGALGWMAWSAAHDDSVLFEPIRVPADIAQQGQDAPALASALQDKVARMRADTDTPRVSARLRDREQSALKVEIPATGVSITDLDQALRTWLGHSRRVSGEVSRPFAGPDRGALVLNLRVDGAPGVRLVRADGDVDALLGEAAEHVYGVIEPLSHATWLRQHGREAKGLEAMRRATEKGPRDDRAFALNNLAAAAQLTGTYAERRELIARSAELSPSVGLNNLAAIEQSVGHAEVALGIFREAARIRRKEPLRAITKQQQRVTLLNAEANVRFALGDPGGRVPRECAVFEIDPCEARSLLSGMAAAGPNRRQQAESVGASLALAFIAQHDLALADQALALLRPLRADAPEQDKLARARSSVNSFAAMAAERGDWAGVLVQAEVYDQLVARWPGLDVPSGARTLRLLAMAHLGDFAGAEAAAAALPQDCYPCLVMRGRLAAFRRDWRSADRWFAEAARQGPSLPQAQRWWAQALIEQGRPKAAARQAAEAHKRSPNYADAAEVWGEALLAQGKAKAAAAKFARAAEAAPNWGRLHLKWGEALAKAGKAAEAREHWKTAAGLNLTADERAELVRLQGVK